MHLAARIKPFIPPVLFRWRELARFFYTQRVKGFDIPAQPHFDGEGTDYFLQALDKCHSYLEYGSGGSTVEAARKGKPFISVDSDRFFLKAVERKIAQTIGDSKSGQYIYSDIGLTGPWGAPIFTTISLARTAVWRRYPQAPWERLGQGEGSFPDLVLVDGRFRVACALISLKNLGQSPFTLLVDDYGDRPYYKEIERFARLDSMQGRMAVFKPKPFDTDEVERALSRSFADWR
jgi:hypothetical protein